MLVALLMPNTSLVKMAVGILTSIAMLYLLVRNSQAVTTIVNYAVAILTWPLKVARNAA